LIAWKYAAITGWIRGAWGCRAATGASPTETADWPGGDETAGVVSVDRRAVGIVRTAYQEPAAPTATARTMTTKATVVRRGQARLTAGLP
jgi:hypothetical protein